MNTSASGLLLPPRRPAPGPGGDPERRLSDEATLPASMTAYETKHGHLSLMSPASRSYGLAKKAFAARSSGRSVSARTPSATSFS